MDAPTTNFAHSYADFGVSSAIGLVKRILNQVVERAETAVDRSRLAALPHRYLDDVGMTVGERAAIVGHEESPLDVWALAATQRL